MRSMHEEAWRSHARCRNANAAEFFPSDALGVTAAQALCAACPVRMACLNYALEHRLDHGVWGGTSERERQRIRHAGSPSDGQVAVPEAPTTSRCHQC